MGRKSSVIASPYAEEMHDLLASGWSPDNVRRYITTQYGDSPAIPSVPALERYRRRHVPAARAVPPSMVRKALGGLHYRVDSLRVLDDLIWAQEQRIGLLWKQEQESGKPDPKLNETVRLAMDCTVTRHKIAVELGVESRPGRKAKVQEEKVHKEEIPGEATPAPPEENWFYSDANLQEILRLLHRYPPDAPSEEG
ncbi:MAG: hypothetical protein WD533_06195 [Dehalococcoidia bacterium]